MKKLLTLIFILGWLTQTVLLAQTLQDAAKQVAEELGKKLSVDGQGQAISISVVEQTSKAKDARAKAIRNKLYQALSERFSGLKLMDEEEAIEGIALNKVLLLQVTYERKAERIFLHVSLSQRMNGERVASIETLFKTEEVILTSQRKFAVVVMDLGSPSLTEVQRKVSTDAFRAALSNTKTFQLVDIEMLADAQQVMKEQKCTAEKCATLLAEQAGSDFSITPSYLGDPSVGYQLSVKMKDEKKNVAEVFQEVLDGEPASLRAGLEKLANRCADWAKDQKQEEIAGAEAKRKQEEQRQKELVESEAQRKHKEAQQKELEKTKRREAVSNRWIWHTTAISLTLLSTWQSYDAITHYNALNQKNKDLGQRYLETTSAEEGQEIKKEIQANQDKMKTYQSTAGTASAITLLSLVWEAYLLWSKPEEVATRPSLLPGTLDLAVAHGNSVLEGKITLRWNWSF